jgi:hypothetical protein
MKQLVFFERYGKMFLRDRPLLYDPAVYEALLRLPKLYGDEGESSLDVTAGIVEG